MHWDELQIAILNTLIVGSGLVLIAVPTATLLAVLLLRTNVIGARWAWLALSSQLVVPLYVFAGSWSAGFGTLGWWPIAQANLGPIEWTNLLAVLFIHAAAAIPWVCLIVALGLVWSQRSLEELAVIEGGWPLVIRLVTLPSLIPWLLLSCVWVFVPVLTEMVVTNLYQVPTLPEQVYLDISLTGTSSWTYAASLGLCILPLFVCGLIVHKLLPPWTELVSRVGQVRQPIYDLRAARQPLTVLVWSIVLGLVALPLANLLFKAGWQTINSSSGLTSHYWSAQRFMLTLWETATLFREEAYWSTLLAVCSAGCAMAVALFFCICGQSIFWRSAFSLICLLLLIIPGPLVAQCVTMLFNRLAIPGALWLYDHTLAAPIVAQQFRLLPLAYLLFRTILASIDARSWELAQLDNFSWREKLRYVILPQTGLRWVAVWFMLAAFSVGELSTNLLVLPPGVTTVAQRLFEFLHFGMRYQDSGLCLSLLAVGWCVAAILWKTRNGFQ